METYINKSKMILVVVLTALSGSSCLAADVSLSLIEKIEIGYINAIFSSLKFAGKAALHPKVQIAAGVLGLGALIASQIHEIKKSSEPTSPKQPITYEQAAKKWALQVGAAISATAFGIFTLHSFATWLKHL